MFVTHDLPAADGMLKTQNSVAECNLMFFYILVGYVKIRFLTYFGCWIMLDIGGGGVYEIGRLGLLISGKLR